MLIVGAKGLAKELLEVCKTSNDLLNLVFYDNINKNFDLLYNKFVILHNDNQVFDYFKTVDKRFILGIGSLKHRISLTKKFVNLGGELTSMISENAFVASYDVEISNGTTVMPGAIISNGVSIGVGCLIYFNVLITHDAKVGDFVKLSPNAVLLGRCKVGDYTHIGSGATILQDIEIGKNVIVAAGAVVIEDVPDNCMVAGVPASIKKHLPVRKL